MIRALLNGNDRWLWRRRDSWMATGSLRMQSHSSRSRLSKTRPYLAATLLLSGAGWIAWDSPEAARHGAIAARRCATIGTAVVISMVDYKRTFSLPFHNMEERLSSVSACHTRSAKRVLQSLLKNGGIYIKLGQHVSSLVVIPQEWSSTMRPLQDQCVPSAYDDIEDLFQEELGASIPDLFEQFAPEPIGVASLAQVHVGKYRKTGQQVAIKVQHPHLDEFCQVDMKTVEVLLRWVKFWFPEFEFSWLAEEMRDNLPKEMNFKVEASNAAKTARDFEGVETSLYIPNGGRVDDKEYLARHKINRNKVALELQRIFVRMVHINGWFHADPHPGNLLIRPSPSQTKSPYNFEIALLDHGLYFDLDHELRINYSKMWLSLIAGDSPRVQADRRKYAELVGNIGPDLYPVFETAITGRLDFDTPGEVQSMSKPDVASGVINRVPQNRDKEAIIDAILNKGGVIEAVFDLLRRVPRRILMVLKLNDLTRNLDQSLETSHPDTRIFIVLARYCGLAVWQDQRAKIWARIRGGDASVLAVCMDLTVSYWRYQKIWNGLRLVEYWMDICAALTQARTCIKTFAVLQLT